MASLSKKILTGSFNSVLNFIVIIIAYPIYLNILGIEIFGLWSLLTVILSLSQAGELGINEAFIRYVSDSVAKGDHVKITAISTTYLSLFNLLFALLSVAVIAFRIPIFSWLITAPEIRNIALEVLPAIILLMFLTINTNIIKGMLIGFGRIDKANNIFSVMRIIQTTLAILILQIFPEIWALIIANVLFYTGSLYIFIKHLQLQHIPLFRVREFKLNSVSDILKFGSAILISRFTQRFFIDEFMKVILSVRFGLAQVAYYDISFRAIQIIRSFYSLSFKALVPYIASISRENGDSRTSFMEIRKTINKSTRQFILPTILPLIGLLFINDYIFGFWLGEKYAPQISVNFILLLPPYLLNFIIVPIYFAYIGLGDSKFFHMITIVNLSSFGIFLGINHMTDYILNQDGIIGAYAGMVFLSTVSIIIYFFHNRYKIMRMEIG